MSDTQRVLLVEEASSGLESVRMELARLGTIETVVAIDALTSSIELPEGVPVLLPMPRSRGDAAWYVTEVLSARPHPYVLVIAADVEPDEALLSEMAPHGLLFEPVTTRELRAVLAAAGPTGARLTAERTLHLLAHALRSVREGVCVTDMRDTILFVNDAFSEMYGYDMHELEGRNIGIIRSPDNPTSIVQEIYPATLRTGWQGELLNLRKNGSEFPVFLSTSTVRDGIGSPIAMLSVATDITERRQQEEALRRAQHEAERANRLKSEFLANMSHEIRTPVNIVLGCADLIEEHLPSEIHDEFSNFFASISQSGKRLLDTIQKIIDISRFHISDFPLLFEDVPLSRVAEEVVRSLDVLARARGLILTLHDAHGDIVMRGDMYAVTHALTNVVENAIKYTESGSIDVLLRDDGSTVEIEVRDTGIGIAHDYLPFIFDEFSQEKGGYGRPYEGTGLGLALTSKFIESCGGTIGVESEKGVGSVFTIRFPALGTAAPHAESGIDRSLAPLLRKAPGGTIVHVLIVDDDAATQQFIRVILSGTCTVHCANTIEEARRILHTTRIDSLILNTGFGGDAGLQFARTLRASDRWSDLPVIGLSTRNDDSERQPAVQAGIDAFVSRPFRISPFIDLVLRVSRAVHT